MGVERGCSAADIFSRDERACFVLRMAPWPQLNRKSGPHISVSRDPRVRYTLCSAVECCCYSASLMTTVLAKMAGICCNFSQLRTCTRCAALGFPYQAPIRVGRK